MKRNFLVLFAVIFKSFVQVSIVPIWIRDIVYSSSQLIVFPKRKFIILDDSLIKWISCEKNSYKKSHNIIQLYYITIKASPINIGTFGFGNKQKHIMIRFVQVLCLIWQTFNSRFNITLQKEFSSNHMFKLAPIYLNFIY